MNTQNIIIQYQKKIQDCECCGRKAKSDEYSEQQELQLEITRFFESAGIEINDKEDLQSITRGDIEVLTFDWILEELADETSLDFSELKIDNNEYVKVIDAIEKSVASYLEG